RLRETETSAPFRSTLRHPSFRSRFSEFAPFHQTYSTTEANAALTARATGSPRNAISSRRPRFSRAGGGRKFQKDGYPRRGGASAFFLNDYGGIGGACSGNNCGRQHVSGARRCIEGGGIDVSVGASKS